MDSKAAGTVGPEMPAAASGPCQPAVLAGRATWQRRPWLPAMPACADRHADSLRVGCRPSQLPYDTRTGRLCGFALPMPDSTQASYRKGMACRRADMLARKTVVGTRVNVETLPSSDTQKKVCLLSRLFPPQAPADARQVGPIAGGGRSARGTRAALVANGLGQLASGNVGHPWPSGPDTCERGRRGAKRAYPSPPPATWTSARMPALIADGRRGQVFAMTAKSGSPSAPRSASSAGCAAVPAARGAALPSGESRNS